jgi:hypothetical protein
MASFRDQALELVPMALAFCAKRFEGRHPKATEWLAVEILKGLQVFMGKFQGEVHHEVDELDELTEEQLRQFILTGQMPVSKPGNAQASLPEAAVPSLSTVCDTR